MQFTALSNADSLTPGFFAKTAIGSCAGLASIYSLYKYHNPQGGLKDAWNLFKSGTGFHISSWYNKIQHGGPFFHRITNHSKSPKIRQDKQGNITKFSDGKPALFLGGLIRSQADLDALKKEAKIDKAQKNNNDLMIVSLTRPFENNWSGFSSVLETNAELLKFFRPHPTTDFSAPTESNLIQIVQELSDRDCPAYVHCKAGRGRSAVSLAAYIAKVLHEQKIDATPANIEHFLRSKRPQVRLNKDHIAALTTFQGKLKKYKSFKRLYYSNKLDNLDSKTKKELGIA